MLGPFERGLVHTVFHTWFQTSGGAGSDYYVNLDHLKYKIKTEMQDGLKGYQLQRATMGQGDKRRAEKGPSSLWNTH